MLMSKKNENISHTHIYGLQYILMDSNLLDRPKKKQTPGQVSGQETIERNNLVIAKH